MKRLKYVWKYYIRPILLGISPNSPEGYQLRIEKLKEDKPRLFARNMRVNSQDDK